jgi:hypothetical protein
MDPLLAYARPELLALIWNKMPLAKKQSKLQANEATGSKYEASDKRAKDRKARSRNNGSNNIIK